MPSNHTLKDRVMLGLSLSDKINPIRAASLAAMVSRSQITRSDPLDFASTCLIERRAGPNRLAAENLAVFLDIEPKAMEKFIALGGGGGRGSGGP